MRAAFSVWRITRRPFSTPNRSSERLIVGPVPSVRFAPLDCFVASAYALRVTGMARKYRLPWEDEVEVTDGSGCGFAIPNRADRHRKRTSGGEF
jgi:hypothetical protein